MRSGLFGVVIVMVVIGVIGAATVEAQPAPASEEVMLRVAQQEMEEDAAGRVPKTHAELLAKQFQVPGNTVEDLHAAKQGWGEIAIRLGVVQELTKTDHKNFPTMAEALQRVGELRADGKGWGELARELGFKLGPVVSEVQRIRQEMRAEAKKSATAGVIKPDQSRERVRSESGR